MALTNTVVRERESERERERVRERERERERGGDSMERTDGGASPEKNFTRRHTGTGRARWDDWKQEDSEPPQASLAHTY